MGGGAKAVEEKSANRRLKCALVKCALGENRALLLMVINFLNVELVLFPANTPGYCEAGDSQALSRTGTPFLVGG